MPTILKSRANGPGHTKRLPEHYLKGSSANPGFGVKEYPCTLDWYPSDDEERWKQNLRDKRDDLKKAGWLSKGDKPKPIEYRINKWGFRGDEIEDLTENPILCLGCSNTFGIGIHEHWTWPAQLKEAIDVPTVNLGVPGGSLDTCVRLASYWTPILEPQAIIVLIPPGVRREIWLDRSGPNHLPEELVGDNTEFHGDEGWWYQYGINKNWNDDFDLLFTSPQEMLINETKNMWALRGLANHFGARFWQLDITRDIPGEIRRSPIKARDLGHHSRDAMGYMIKNIVKEWKRQDG